MKTISLLAIIFFSYNSFTQDCKYDKDEIDSFTGKKIKITSKATVFADVIDPQNKSLFFRFNLVDASTSLSVSCWSYSIVSISKMDKLLIKLSNNEIIELECLQPVVASSYSGKWHLDIDYFLSTENLKKIQTLSIVSVRLSTTSNNIDYDVKPKNAIKLMASANCIN